MSSYFLTTERLGLRCWSADDLSLAMNLWGDPKIMAMIDVRGQLSSAEVQEILDKHIATQRTFGVQYWPMFVLNTGEHAGCCGLRPYTAAERTFELGAHLVPRFWRQGTRWKPPLPLSITHSVASVQRNWLRDTIRTMSLRARYLRSSVSTRRMSSFMRPPATCIPRIGSR
jgi:hypothetical protein